MKRTLWESLKYRKFTLERNKALEQINLNCQTDVSRMLFERLERITHFVSYMAIQEDISMMHLSYLVDQLRGYIDAQFLAAIPEMESRISRMRKATFTLTYLGELEAIARATKKTKYIMPHEFKARVKFQQAMNTILDKKWEVTLWIAFSRLKQRIIQKFTAAVTLDKTPKEVVDAIKDAYPEASAYKRPPKVLKNLRESDKDDQDGEAAKKEFDFYAGLTTDEDWQLAVDAYKGTELPVSRFDNSPTFDPDTGYARYNWEIEQDMTDDFVNQVRDGQVEAATELGVKDFVWVAVIDNKTCDACCLPRNGKTVTEIEAMLKSGELSEDECDAIVPPAHPNCRCDLAPIAITDEVEGADWKSFGEWLES